MRLFKFLIIPLSVFALCMACQEDSVNSGNGFKNTDVLGLVVPNQSGESLEKIFLLNDGRRLNPVSGIENFDQVQLGAKFLISFKSEKTVNGIIYASVTNYSDANDSTFTPKNVIPGNAPEQFKGIYRGVLTMVNVELDSTANNFTILTDTLVVNFTGNTYVCTPPSNNSHLGGSGHFSKSSNKFNFIDNNTWPAGSDPKLILDGHFDYYLDSNQLNLYAVKNGWYLSYYLFR